MGISQQAQLSWGFSIPEDKLPTLLQFLRGPDGKMKNEPPLKRHKTDRQCSYHSIDMKDIKELEERVSDLLEEAELYNYVECSVSGCGEDGIEDDVALEFYYQSPSKSSSDPKEAGKDDKQVHPHLNYYIEGRGRENYGVSTLALGNLLSKPPATEDIKDKIKELHEALHLKELGIEVMEQWFLTMAII